MSRVNIEEELRRQYIVNLEEHTCDCRRWQVSGIPCAHALAILLHLRKDPFSYVARYFQSRLYQQTYACPIYPISDPMEWMPDFEFLNSDSDDDADEDIPSTLPPNTRRPSGWPKNTRDRNSPERDEDQPKKLYRCSRCDGFGYNRKTCQNPI